jgi:Transposase IS66 family
MVEIDHNWAENGMRGVALGRKNWIHLGREESGTKIATILSVLEMCNLETENGGMALTLRLEITDGDGDISSTARGEDAGAKKGEEVCGFH